MNVSPSEAPALLNTALQRLAAQSASCKLLSIVLTSLVLVMAAGRVGAEALVWAASPSLLLALADAAYKVLANRIAALAAKETVRAEDLFRIQSGNVGFGVAIQSLSGLTSFSVWPFYTTLTTIVIVLGQTVLVPQNKSQFLPQSPSINASPFQPNSSRPTNAGQQFQTPPNQINANRSIMPSTGGQTFIPNFPGVTTTPPTRPGSSSTPPATNSFAPQPSKPKQTPNSPPNSVPPKLAPSQTQQPK